MATKEIGWNLSEIFPKITDPSVQTAIVNVRGLAAIFEKKYRGKIRELSPKEVLSCLHEFEDYAAKQQAISLYASLSFAANMTLPETQALNDKVNKLEAELGKSLVFFELELGRSLKAKPAIILNPVLAEYRHTLERIKRYVVHQLSEVEEQLIIEKDQFGVKAWEELQSKWLNTRTLEVSVEGKRSGFPTVKQTDYCPIQTAPRESQPTGPSMEHSDATAKSLLQP